MLTCTSGGSEQDSDHTDSVVVGLVNNMPDAALRTTERQFCQLLSEAARNCAVSLKLFFLPEIHRGHEAQTYLRGHYAGIGDLWGAHLDGLIVTGTEPRAAVLSDEPYWPGLAKLVDWAEDHTTSSIWSCLAAQAAVLRRDGISRRRLPEKLFGVFDCTKATEHPILAGAPPRWRVPHSRWNDLTEETLAEKGYSILSRSDAAGADLFAKRGNSLFVFLQGHPEYDGDALLHEYRRNVQRFLADQKDGYPEMPRGYFDGQTAAALAALKARALRHRDTDLLRGFPVVPAERIIECDWRHYAIQLYANWLSFLVERKYFGRRPPASIGSAGRPRSALAQ